MSVVKYGLTEAARTGGVRFHRHSANLNRICRQKSTAAVSFCRIIAVFYQNTEAMKEIDTPDQGQR